MKSQELFARKTKTWKTAHQFIPIVITMIALVWIIVSAAEPIKASAISDKTVNITSGSQQIYWGTEPGYSFSYYPASVFSNSATTPPTYSYTGKNYIFNVNAHTGKNQRRGQIYAWKNGKLAGTLTVVQAGHTHSYNKGWQTRKEPTCGTTGIKYRICSICRYEETKTIAATGNHYCRSGWITDKAKGCFTDGKRHQVCSVCLKNVNYVTLPAYGCHNWGSWSVKKEATCAQTGRRIRYCSRCGGKQEEDIPTIAHDWYESKIVKNGSCTQAGLKLMKCRVCGSTKNVTYGGSHNWVENNSQAFPKKQCSICKDYELSDKEKTFRDTLRQADNAFTDEQLNYIVADINDVYGISDDIRKQTEDLGRWFELCQLCTGCNELCKIADACEGLNNTCDYFDLAWTAYDLVNKKRNGEKINQNQLKNVITSLRTLCGNMPHSSYYTKALNSIQDASSKMMKVVNKNKLKTEISEMISWLVIDDNASFLDTMTDKELEDKYKYNNAKGTIIAHYNAEVSTVDKSLFPTSEKYWELFLRLKKNQYTYSNKPTLSGFLGECYLPKL